MTKTQVVPFVRIGLRYLAFALVYYGLPSGLVDETLADPVLIDAIAGGLVLLGTEAWHVWDKRK